jgi:hypothetical protein
MKVARGSSAIRSAISALFFFVEHASLPAVPHVDAISGAIIRANLELEAELVPLVTELASSRAALCSHSPVFATLARDTITKLEAIEQLTTRDPLIIPFNVCSPSCKVCQQLHAFCTTSTATSTTIAKAGARSTNRRHLMRVLQPHDRHVDISTNTSR